MEDLVTKKKVFELAKFSREKVSSLTSFQNYVETPLKKR